MSLLISFLLIKNKSISEAPLTAQSGGTQLSHVMFGLVYLQGYGALD
jgi:hypothetical protein